MEVLRKPSAVALFVLGIVTFYFVYQQGILFFIQPLFIYLLAPLFVIVIFSEGIQKWKDQDEKEFLDSMKKSFSQLNIEPQHHQKSPDQSMEMKLQEFLGATNAIRPVFVMISVIGALSIGIGGIYILGDGIEFSEDTFLFFLFPIFILFSLFNQKKKKQK